MAKQDTKDFVAAFAIGAALGVGAALLLRGEDHDQAHRVLRRTTPLRREAARRVRLARKHLTKHMRDTGSAGEDLLETGREALGLFRGQVAEIIASARADIARAVRESMREARRAARHRSRR